MLDPISKKVIAVHYKLNGVSVCAGAWAGFYGIRPTTAAAIHRQLLKNHDVWNDGLAKETMLAKRNERAYLENAAAAWWYIRLGYYEMIVDYGHILYPRDVCWSSVYEDEFVPEVRELVYHWKKPSNSLNAKAKKSHDEERIHNIRQGTIDDMSDDDRRDAAADGGDDDWNEHGSISTWYRGRKLALQQLAKDKLGDDAKPFKFISRAKHSAYVGCTHVFCSTCICLNCGTHISLHHDSFTSVQCSTSILVPLAERV